MQDGKPQILIETENEEISYKVVYVKIPSDMHQKLKLKVIEQGTTITDIVTEYLEKYLQEKTI